MIIRVFDYIRLLLFRKTARAEEESFYMYLQSREKKSEQVAQDEKIKQSSSSFFLSFFRLLIFCVFADGFAYMNGHLLDDYRQGRSNVITHVKIFFYFFFVF